MKYGFKNLTIEVVRNFDGMEAGITPKLVLAKLDLVLITSSREVSRLCKAPMIDTNLDYSFRAEFL